MNLQKDQQLKEGIILYFLGFVLKIILLKVLYRLIRQSLNTSYF